MDTSKAVNGRGGASPARDRGKTNYTRPIEGLDNKTGECGEGGTKQKKKDRGSRGRREQEKAIPRVEKMNHEGTACGVKISGGTSSACSSCSCKKF